MCVFLFSQIATIKTQALNVFISLHGMFYKFWLLWTECELLVLAWLSANSHLISARVGSSGGGEQERHKSSWDLGGKNILLDNPGGDEANFKRDSQKPSVSKQTAVFRRSSVCTTCTTKHASILGECTVISRL